jgi:hypothetical protein
VILVPNIAPSVRLTLLDVPCVTLLIICLSTSAGVWEEGRESGGRRDERRGTDEREGRWRGEREGRGEETRD